MIKMVIVACSLIGSAEGDSAQNAAIAQLECVTLSFFGPPGATIEQCNNTRQKTFSQWQQQGREDYSFVKGTCRSL